MPICRTKESRVQSMCKRSDRQKAATRARRSGNAHLLAGAYGMRLSCRSLRLPFSCLWAAGSQEYAIRVQLERNAHLLAGSRSKHATSRIGNSQEGGVQKGGLCKGGAIRGHLLAPSSMAHAHDVQKGCCTGGAYLLLANTRMSCATHMHTRRQGAGNKQVCVTNMQYTCTHRHRGCR